MRTRRDIDEDCEGATKDPKLNGSVIRQQLILEVLLDIREKLQ